MLTQPVRRHTPEAASTTTVNHATHTESAVSQHCVYCSRASLCPQKYGKRPICRYGNNLRIIHPHSLQSSFIFIFSYLQLKHQICIHSASCRLQVTYATGILRYRVRWRKSFNTTVSMWGYRHVKSVNQNILAYDKCSVVLGTGCEILQMLSSVIYSTKFGVTSMHGFK